MGVALAYAAGIGVIGMSTVSPGVRFGLQGKNISICWIQSPLRFVESIGVDEAGCRFLGCVLPPPSPSNLKFLLCWMLEQVMCVKKIHTWEFWWVC